MKTGDIFLGGGGGGGGGGSISLVMHITYINDSDVDRRISQSCVYQGGIVAAPFSECKYRQC